VAGFALGAASRRTALLGAASLVAGVLPGGGPLLACAAGAGALRGSHSVVRLWTVVAMASATLVLMALRHWTGGWWEVAYRNWSQS
jgi:hypothetical protein